MPPWLRPRAIGPEPIAHAETGDHLAGHPGHLLEVVGGTGGDFVVAVDDLFGHAATQGHRHLVLQVGPAVQARLHALFDGVKKVRPPACRGE
jgi:hypothetical protein